ncbi:hypothetical protein [Streptomyces alanosinicus]|uniref:Uncharacterized protein n=1 Tax=Streptomyces alanosinicus TaxID=68171 RepID=A0A918MI94_9ACTN|nr:hypothetical protein [Streptomyces alanosinicus]GGW24471.1 hypothetical protein GCM10010339_94260 [Streptomyces alanosinicus]
MTMAEEGAQHTARETDALRAGHAAAAGLKEALARVGVVIPSLRASQPVSGSGFVELGGCSAGTAITLAEVINSAADALPELRATVR